MTTHCPCLSGISLDECCGPLLRGETLAPTAEQLMRSRFSAFAVGNADYLLATWHPSTRPPTLQLDLERRWYRLDIIKRTAGGPLDTRGTVTFDAFWRSGDDRGAQREVSNFARENGRWFYVAALDLGAGAATPASPVN